MLLTHMHSKIKKKEKKVLSTLCTRVPINELVLLYWSLGRENTLTYMCISRPLIITDHLINSVEEHRRTICSSFRSGRHCEALCSRTQPVTHTVPVTTYPICVISICSFSSKLVLISLTWLQYPHLCCCVFLTYQLLLFVMCVRKQHHT